MSAFVPDSSRGCESVAALPLSNFLAQVAETKSCSSGLTDSSQEGSCHISKGSRGVLTAVCPDVSEELGPEEAYKSLLCSPCIYDPQRMWDYSRVTL